MKGEGKERKMEREGEGKGNEGGLEGPPISCWHRAPRRVNRALYKKQ